MVFMINGQREHHEITGTVSSTLCLPAEGTERCQILEWLVGKILE